jgi:putative effector of murein hydrolase LrgA (UPF0299 family)
MIVSLALLLLCQLLGEVMARMLSLPLPGPIIGMILMLGLLLLRDKITNITPNELRDGTLEKTSGVILANLSLLFVPAGVGVVQRLDLFVTHGVALVIALLASTLLAGLATFRLIVRVSGDKAGGEE